MPQYSRDKSECSSRLLGIEIQDGLAAHFCWQPQPHILMFFYIFLAQASKVMGSHYKTDQGLGSNLPFLELQCWFCFSASKASAWFAVQPFPKSGVLRADLKSSL